jgi:hypothetical protein
MPDRLARLHAEVATTPSGVRGVGILAGTPRLSFRTYLATGLAGHGLRFGIFTGPPQARRAWL